VPETRLRVHPAAAAELEAAVRWYASQCPRVAGDFVREVNTCAERLRDAPDRWPRDVHRTRQHLLPSFPLRLIYQARNGAINLVAVAQGARRPGIRRGRPRTRRPSHSDAGSDGARTQP
jgi:plasmid stabilization system protein ParE